MRERAAIARVVGLVEPWHEFTQVGIDRCELSQREERWLRVEHEHAAVHATIIGVF